MNVTNRTLDGADVAILWRETANVLDRLLGEVREGKNVMLASQFARWVEFSCLHRVFEAYPCQTPALRVDAALLDRKVRDLVFECGERFKDGKVDAKYTQSDIAEINRKLDLLMHPQGLGLTPPLVATAFTVTAVPPAMHGGAL